MATATITPFLSIEEYLHTTYRPDVDYVDGHLEERNSGEFDHGNLQGIFFEIFRRDRKIWQVRPALDCRVQVSPTRFRIPDVCIVSVEYPKEQVIRHTPMLCIEIVSPEDTLAKLLRRAEDFFAMGVPTVWWSTRAPAPFTSAPMASTAHSRRAAWPCLEPQSASR